MTVRRILGCHLAKFTHLLILSLTFYTQCYNLWCLSSMSLPVYGTWNRRLHSMYMSPAEPGDPSCFHTGFPLDQSSPEQSSHMEGPSSQNPNSNCYGICGTKQNIFLISKPCLLRKAKEGINERRKHCFCIHSDPDVWAVEGQAGPQWHITLSHPDVSHLSFLLHVHEAN